MTYIAASLLGVTFFVSILTLVALVLGQRSFARRLESAVDELREQNYNLGERIKTMVTKDDLSTQTAGNANFATKTDIISFSNKITDIHYELSALTAKQNGAKPKSALNGHKAEKELEVYEKLWKATGDLYFSLEKMNVPKGKSADSSLLRTGFENVIGNYQNLRREAENQRIFYPKELYVRLQNMLHEVKNEVALLETSIKSKDSIALSAHTRKSLEKIRAEVERIHNYIRVRLNQL